MEKSKAYLTKHIDEIRRGTSMTQAHHYLHNRLRNGVNFNQWSNGDWRSLQTDFGEDVARAFRDAAVEFWRRHRPTLQSEGASPNSTPIQVPFGLLGLAVEATERDGWLESLTAGEAELAARYAVLELNGFPPWLPSIFGRFPDIVTKLLFREIEFELAEETAEAGSSYVLYDVSWSGDWAWRSIAPRLGEHLRQVEPQRTANLNYLLSIVQGTSAISDEELSSLARQKCGGIDEVEHLGIWCAVWTGVQPASAVAWLQQRLKDLDSPSATKLAMHYVVHLLGNRNSVSRARPAFKTPAILKDLYLLVHGHVRQGEDIDRAGRGVYSPGLRDYAQEARDHIFQLLNEMPGKAAYSAIVEIAKLHPDPSSSPYLLMHAKRKAEREADSSPWTPEQVRVFAHQQQLVPATPRDLFDLGRLRLEDLRDSLEDGDDSIAPILREVNAETKLRTYIAGWLRDRAFGLYGVAQEDELSDAKRPDIRIYGNGLDAPVPIELKIVDNGWSGPSLIERLEVQLCQGYTRDLRSRFGIFALVWRGEQSTWRLPSGVQVGFNDLLAALRNHWKQLAPNFTGIDEVAVVGIDLTKRDRRS